MNKRFVTPFYEVVRFGSSDIVSTSGCCDVGGIQFDKDDEVCSYGDAKCKCTDVDPLVNCSSD